MENRPVNLCQGRKIFPFDLKRRQWFPQSDGEDKEPLTNGDHKKPSPSLMGETGFPKLDREDKKSPAMEGEQISNLDFQSVGGGKNGPF